MSTTTDSPIIVAFDFDRIEPARELAAKLDPAKCRAKVGKELFTACGMAAVDMLHQRGYEVFLDLKFHDIPNTVAKAVSVAANAGIWMLNVHASGGAAMMGAAQEVITKANAKTHLIAVTVLTSIDEQEWQRIGFARPIEEQVTALATQAKDCGLAGVVCSAQEASTLRNALGDNFLLVTPGIRPAGQAGGDDQKRTLTPAEAMAAGSSYLVVGRPITQASDPAAVLREMVRDPA